jgi:integrase
MPKKRNHGDGGLIQIFYKKDPVTGEKKLRSPFWYAVYYDTNGKQVRFNTKKTVKAEALTTLRNLMTGRDNGAPDPNQVKSITYGALRDGLVQSYLEKGNKSLLIRADGTETVPGLTQLDNFFGFSQTNPGPSVTEITVDIARDFVKKRRAEGAENAIINRSLACLRRMLNIALEDGKIQRVPKIHFQKEPPPRPGFTDLEKFEELIAQFPPNLKPYITFLYFCGGRSGEEAKTIEWPQVDLERRIIRVEAEQTKDKDARYIPLPPRLVLMLERIEPKVGLVFDTTNIRKEWIKACAAVGLGRIIEVEGKPYDPRYEGLTLHDFRRSAIRNLVTLGGVREKVAMEITGHKTRSVFDRYHIVDTTDVLEAMNQWDVAAQKIMRRAARKQRLKSAARGKKLLKK